MMQSGSGGLNIFNFFVGNFLLVYLNITAAMQSKQYNLIPAAITTPFYWVLMSIASIVAVYDLIKKPFHWQKTAHGLILQRESTSIMATETQLWQRV